VRTDRNRVTPYLPRRREHADHLLDVHEAASILAVKPTTLYQWAYQRRIPVVKLMGRTLRFRESDLRKLIAEGVRPALGRNQRP
jgi:excisionase family DNA binding protein